MAICNKTYKIRYSSNRLARQAIDQINRKITSNHLTHTYKCVHCDDWHTTSMSINKSKAIATHKEKRESLIIESVHMPRYISGRLEYLQKKIRPYKKK